MNKIGKFSIFTGILSLLAVAGGHASVAAESQQSALVISDEIYIPDSVREKYNLDAPSVPVPPVEVVTGGLVQPPSMLELPVPQKSAIPATLAKGPVATVQSWRARKGEDLQTVLKRWSARSGVDLQWNSANAPKLSDEVSYVGTFEDAVAALLKHADSGPLSSSFAN